MIIPSRLLEKLALRCFPNEPPAAAAFIEAVVTPRDRTSAILWLDAPPAERPFATLPQLDWQPAFVDRVAADIKPGQHPLHDSGAFYVLDFSSVFAASVVTSILPQTAAVNLVLDVCSAPGGKAIFASRALAPKLLLCNEVIRKRCKALISNLARCNVPRSAVLSLDPKPLADRLTGLATLVIVDAPCSGQSLLVKGKPVPGCFHPRTITMNLRRQRRILAEASAAVTPGSFLAYMTCTYSPEENEEVVEWFCERFPEFSPLEVPPLKAFRTHLSELPAYRLWPQSQLGAGSFVTLFTRARFTSAESAEPICPPVAEIGDLSDLQRLDLRPLWTARS